MEDTIEKAESEARQEADSLNPDVVYFAAIRLAAHATTNKYRKTIVPELGMMEAIERWDIDFRK